MPEPTERTRHQPLTGTGPHKRANEDRLLRQVYLSLRELQTRFGALLDMVGAILMDRETRELAETEAPTAPPVDTDANSRATTMHRAVTRDDLVDSATQRWAQARTEADRAKVFEMLRSGRDHGLLNEEELLSLESRFREA